MSFFDEIPVSCRVRWGSFSQPPGKWLAKKRPGWLVILALVSSLAGSGAYGQTSSPAAKAQTRPKDSEPKNRPQPIAPVTGKPAKKKTKLEGFHNGIFEGNFAMGRREAIFLDALYEANLDQSTTFSAFGLNTFPFLDEKSYLFPLGIGFDYSQERAVTTRVRTPDNEVLLKVQHQRSEWMLHLHYRLTHGKKNSLMGGLVVIPFRQVNLNVTSDTGTFTSKLQTQASGPGFGVELGFNMLRGAYGRLDLLASPLTAQVVNQLQNLKVKDQGTLSLIEGQFVIGIQNFGSVGKITTNVYLEGGIQYREQTFGMDQVNGSGQVQTDIATIARVGCRLL